MDSSSDSILTHSAKKFDFRLYKKADRFSLNEERSGAPGNRTPLYNIMSEEHKMTQQDKLVLTITLAAIFLGTFFLGLVGLIVNLSS